jgi:orotate phosphoribosyltransferase
MEPDSVEIRVLGCLIEKQRTTPDAYPLSLNALRLACNQSTNREPVVDYDEQAVVEALRRLALRGWTRLASGAGSRARKYRHLLNEAIGLDDAEISVMAVLMLRGPQTPGELKQRGQRLHDLGDLGAVHETLDRLIERELVSRHARQPGQKEDRYEQLLGEGSSEAAASTAVGGGNAGGGLDVAKATLLTELREHSLVIGEVTLSSGATAQYYVDARRALLRPAGFRAAGELIAAAAVEAGATAVGGPATAAIPPSCAALAVPAGEDLVGFFVRGERKQHGLQRWVEGPVEPGDRCLVVEDTVTSGGSTVAAIERIREQGLEIAGVVAVVDRLAGGGEAIEVAASAPYKALLTIDEIYPDRPDEGEANLEGGDAQD